jgi:3-deoxy-D-manno-octulosonic-acid transferase
MRLLSLFGGGTPSLIRFCPWATAAPVLYFFYSPGQDSPPQRNPNPTAWKPFMVRMLYSLALYLLTPIFFACLLLLGLRDRGFWKGWAQRLGWPVRTVKPGGIVVHAVSVGEVNAAEPLVRALLRRYPGLPLTLTCFTPTGAARIHALFGDSVTQCYWPLDLPGAVRRFLRRARPRLVIILETEIWLNFYTSARRQGIPLMLANGRISDTSFKRYQRLHRLTAAALAEVDCIATQSEQDQQRFIALGAPPARTTMAGNLKYELQLPDTLRAEGLTLRLQLGSEREVWLAASTREGEEAVVLEAFQSVLQEFPRALLVIVPRHPQRFDEVARLVEANGLRLSRFSQHPTSLTSTNCFLVDAMGELLRFYAACDVAFVGGSLANTGGHNVLEPAALGRPVLVGPNTFNFAEVTDGLVAAGGALRVTGVESLQQSVKDLLRDSARRQRMGQAGQAFVARQQGALARSLELADRLINP